MSKVLIGYTGFVGSNLLEQDNYDVLINSKNCDELRNKHFDKIVCAGVSAVKWKANKFPEEDLANINKLIDVLSTVTADKFVLISTVDVYNVLTNANEDTICTDNTQAYGKNRLYFEEWCKSHFKNVLIVRLPGLFGNNLKKNVIFDLLHDNCLDMINPDSSFQYYYLKNLTNDIKKAESKNINLINLFTEPIKTQEIIDLFFSNKVVGENKNDEIHYDLYTKYAKLNNHTGNYLYSKQEILKYLKEFINAQ